MPGKRIKKGIDRAGLCPAFLTKSPTVFDKSEVNVRIAHLKIAHWGAILRWAILSLSVIRIAHPNYKDFYELFVLDMGPG